MGGAQPPEQSSAAAGSPELAVLALQWIIWVAVVQNDELGMGCPLGYLGRSCKAGSRLLDGEGGSAATGFAGVRGLGT